MSVEKIIQESVNKNPLGMKEALEEELRSRLALALEAKMNNEDDDDEDDDDELDEAKSADDFMKLLKIKSEPEVGKRMNLGGYPFDYDGFEDDEIYLNAVDKDAAAGLAKEFRKKGFKSKFKGTDVTVMVESYDLEESASKYGVDTGPLMKANAWIKPAKLSAMVETLRDEGEYKNFENFAIGRLEKPTGKSSQVAISIHDQNPNQYFKKGMNKPHTFYYDTGRGHRQTQETISITGMVTVGGEGQPKTTGKVNMNERTTLMVFK